MAENCHRKKISYRHGRELPQEKNFISTWPRTATGKNFISAWPRTATGKKFHIGMSENCHLKKNLIAMAENCHLKKNHIAMAENCHRKKISYRHGRELPLHTRTASYPGAF